MNKIQLLQERKAKVVDAGKEIRSHIQTIADEDSIRLSDDPVSFHTLLFLHLAFLRTNFTMKRWREKVS